MLLIQNHSILEGIGGRSFLEYEVNGKTISIEVNHDNSIRTVVALKGPSVGFFHKMQGLYYLENILGDDDESYVNETIDLDKLIEVLNREGELC